MPYCKARQLAAQTHMALCLVGGLANLAVQETEKGRECQEAGRLLSLQSGEQGAWKVWESIESDEGMGELRTKPPGCLKAEGGKCHQLSKRKLRVFQIKSKFSCAVIIY